MWSMVSKAADRYRRVRTVTDPLAILRRILLLNIKEGTFSRMVFSIR